MAHTPDPKDGDASDPKRARARGEEDTSVDLGDDLLERTRAIDRADLVAPDLPTSHDGSSASPSVASEAERESPSERRERLDDQLQSARILINENLSEEAKRVLRRILIADSRNLEASKMLSEIHDLELKQIFSEGGPRRQTFKESSRERDAKAASALDGSSATPDGPGSVDPDELIDILDRDLKLGIGPSEKGVDQEPGIRGLSLFENPKALERFARKLDRELAGASPRDRIDMGIAFLEMALWELATRQFKAAAAIADDPKLLLSANSLLARSLILSGHPFDAIQALQRSLRDLEIPHDSKAELFYLLGSANERLQRGAEAVGWYNQALALQPGYRDASDRVMRITLKAVPRK